MPEVTVEIMKDVPTTMPDGTVEYSDGVLVTAPSERDVTGSKYVEFIVDDLSLLNQPEIRSRYVKSAGYSLAAFERTKDGSPGGSGEDRQREALYADAINLKLLEALAGAA